MQKAKELVIEIERVRLIRRRSPTSLMNCSRCQKETDFISLPKAARLFDTRIECLLRFLVETKTHFRDETGGEIFICVQSLLAHISEYAVRSGQSSTYEWKLTVE